MVKKKRAQFFSGDIPEQFEPASKLELQKGQLVKSIAGRDKGTIYLTLGREGDILYLADGRSRGVTRPKKKNIRHVQKYNRVAADQVVRAGGRQLRDEEIRAGVRELLQANEGIKEGAYV